MHIVTSVSDITGYLTNITWTKGEFGPIRFTVSSNGSVVDITGYSFVMQIDLPISLILSTDSGDIIITDAGHGNVEIEINDTNSTSLLFGSYPYRVIMTSTSNTDTQILVGNFTVIAGLQGSITPCSPTVTTATITKVYDVPAIEKTLSLIIRDGKNPIIQWAFVDDKYKPVDISNWVNCGFTVSLALRETISGITLSVFSG